MSSVKVSALSAKTSPSGSEELLINDGGTSKKITIANLTKGHDLPTVPSGITTDTNKEYNLKLTDVSGTETLTWIEETDTDTTYSTATTTTEGLVKIEDDTAQTIAANTVTATVSRTYGVQLNASDQAVVNVPWTDTDTGITDVVDDTTPQLGGNLDFQTHKATSFTSTGIDDNATSTQLTITDTNVAFGADTSCINMAVAEDIRHAGDGNTYLSFEADTLACYVGGTNTLQLTSGQMMSPTGITLGNGTTYAAANTLDDYEEGIFTPNIQPTTGSITWSTSVDKLSYTKIGRVVHITGNLLVSSVSSPSGITRGSVPFTQSNLDQQAERTISPIFVTGTSLPMYSFGTYPNGGTDSYLELIRTNTSSVNRDGGSYLGAGDNLYFNHFYIAN